jgi:cobalamin biosynthesis protein CobT
MNISAPFGKTLLGGTLAALLLAGCSAPAAQQASASSTVPGSLQERARSVMQLARDKDYAGALTQVDSLTKDVRDAGAAGKLPRQQWQQAEAALAQLRTDLATLTGGVSPASADSTTSAPAPSATPSPSASPEDNCDDQSDRDSQDNSGTADDEEDGQDHDWSDRTSADDGDGDGDVTHRSIDSTTNDSEDSNPGIDSTAGNGSAVDDAAWLAEAGWRDN